MGIWGDWGGEDEFGLVQCFVAGLPRYRKNNSRQPKHLLLALLSLPVRLQVMVPSLYRCSYVCVHMQSGAHAHKSQRVMLFSLLALDLELIDLASCGQCALGIFLSPLSALLPDTRVTDAWSFDMVAGDPNPGLHSCVAGSLTMKPSPQS